MSARRWSRCSGLEAAAGDRTLVVLADGGQTAVEILLAGVENDDGDAGIGETHADAPAHGAGSHDAEAGDRPCLDVCRQTRNPAHFALGEEQVPESAAFGGALDLIDRLRSKAMPSSNFLVTDASTASSRTFGRVAVAHGLVSLRATRGDHCGDSSRRRRRYARACAGVRLPWPASRGRKQGRIRSDQR